MPWQYQKEYQAWQDMIRRCFHIDHWNYKNYGGRGITVCERWKSFNNFITDLGPAPSQEYSLDRYPDNDGNYQLDNCRWATQAEQMRNRRNTLWVPWQGEMIPVVELATLLGKEPLPFARYVWQRIHRHGYTPEEAIKDEDGRTGGRRKQNSTLVQVDDGPVISLQEASNLQGIDYKTVNQRRYRGASLAEALNLVGRLTVVQEITRPRIRTPTTGSANKSSILVKIDDGPVISLQEAAEQLGQNYRVVQQRRSRDKYTTARALGLTEDRVTLVRNSDK